LPSHIFFFNFSSPQANSRRVPRSGHDRSPHLYQFIIQKKTYQTQSLRYRQRRKIYNKRTNSSEISTEFVIQAKKTKRVDQLVRDEINIELQPNNMNKEGAFSISRSWRSFIHSLKNRQQKGLSMGGKLLSS